MSVVDVIQHYQRSIEKCGDDQKRMLHCINKLCRLPITVQHLKETGVGRTVNALRKYEGQVGEAAKYTVTKWKQMVADEESSEDDGDAAAAEAYQENANEDYGRADEEEEPDELYNNSVVRENSKHAHRESHSKSRKDENHRPHSSKSEHKMQKEKVQRDEDQNKKKHKDHHKYEDLNHTEEKQSHKRKSNSSKSHSIEEKRRKYDSDNENGSDGDSESQEMQIDEQENADSYAVAGSDEELEDEEQQQQQEEKDDSDDNDSDNRGSMSDSSSRLPPPSHKHQSKHHSSSSVGHHSGSSSVHHSKHHKESHRKHEKHKEKKSSSSDKHIKKSDSDKVSERTSGSNHKDKHSKHKDNKHEHKSNKHKSSASVSSSNNSGETNKEKEHPKHKIVNSVKDSEPQAVGDKKRIKEKPESAEKNSSSSKHQKSSKSKTKESKDKKRKNVVVDEDDDGITSMSGASFAEALGMVDPLIKKKTNTSGSTSNSKANRNTNSKVPAAAEKSSSKSKEMKPPKAIPSVQEEPSLLSSTVQLEPLKVDLDSTLPEISPNYRPLPHPNMDSFPQRKAKTMSEEDALALAMSQKNQRTRVYSGMRSGKSWSSVPSLFDICVRVLQEHIEAIEYTGGVPYDLLKPVLIIATPEQLFTLEHYNPYLIEDTDELWEFHCKKSFRSKQREDMETWRDMYIRCLEEREAKLKALTSNIQQSIAKSTPVRQTKLAYVDSVVKPPRNVAKQQAKYGTATTSTANKVSPLKGPKPGISGNNAGASLSPAAAHVAVPPPRGVQSVTKVKPRMAPLMQKTMKLVKSFKR